MSLFGDLPAPRGEAEKEASTTAADGGVRPPPTKTALASVVRRIAPAAPIRRFAPVGRPAVRGRRVSSATPRPQPTLTAEFEPDVGVKEKTGWEYDPMHPNEFEVLVEKREEQRRLDLQNIGHSPPAQERRNQREIQSSAKTGEEAFLRRAGLSRPQTAPAQLSGRDIVEAPGFATGPRRGGPDTAAKMMQRMGWERGRGLGKQQQGNVEPVGVSKMVVDHIGEADRGPKSIRAQESNNVLVDPPTKRIKANSRVILMRNMVGVSEVDGELEQETTEECTKYGRVRRCVIHIPHEGANDVNIFVEFEEPEAASRALLDLEGRFFGGRKVRASLFPEDMFQTGQYSLPELSES